VPIVCQKAPRVQLLIQAALVFLVAFAFLISLAPSAPFTKELGVCESGAVRDVLAGNIILPRFLPGPIVHVPPLYWWLAALCVKAIGWNELALRLPSLVAAALTCTIVFAWTSKTVRGPTGLWAAAALLGCHFFLDAARQPRMDSMLTLFVTAAVISLQRALSATPQSPAPHWYFAACSAMGLGALTKGILGVLLPGLAVALFLAARGRFRELFRPGMLMAFLGASGIGLGWYIAAYRVGGRPFLEWQLRMNLWNRFIPVGAGGAQYCAHPFWYFVPHVLTGFLPWSLYLPAFALAAWPSSERKLPEPIVYAICWFVALFSFFSSSNGKCLIYILPVFPALAILVGWTVEQVQVGSASERSIKQVFSGGAVLVALATAGIVTIALILVGYGVPPNLAVRLHPTDRRFLELLVGRGYSIELFLWGSLSILSCVLILIGVIWGMAAIEAAGTLMVAAIGGWFWFAVMNAALARGESLKSFARQADRVVPATDQIDHFGLGDCELNFYCTRPLRPISQISCAGHYRNDRYILIRKVDFDALPDSRRRCFAIELHVTPNDSIGPRLLLRQTAPGD
jgi:4-amino-4-deoxy-L-arabinose transferase-like glycosyltransferase